MAIVVTEIRRWIGSAIDRMAGKRWSASALSHLDL